MTIFLRRYNQRSQAFRWFEISILAWYIFHSIKLWQATDIIVSPYAFYGTPKGRFPLGIDLILYKLGPEFFSWALLLTVVFSIAALCIEAGFFTKAILWILYINILGYCPSLGDGGTTLLATLWFFYLFIDVKNLEDPANSIIKNLFNAVLIFSLQYQVVVVYLQAALSKIRTDGWSSGVALYYILQVPEFTNPFFAAPFLKSDVLVVLMTFATIAFQLGFLFAMMMKRLKLWWLFSGILFHLGIALCMGLVCFGIFMIMSYILFLRNEDVQKILNFHANIKKNLFKFNH